jgi:fumarate reductase (CoM/CoB) subunit B
LATLYDNACFKCGACQISCPVVAIEGIDRFSGPRSLAVEAVRFGDEASGTREDIMRCTTCYRCGEVCPARIPLPERIIEVRRRIFQRDLALSGHQRIMDNIDRYGRAVEPMQTRFRSPDEKGKEVLYFPGCIGELRLIEIPDSAINVLSKVGSITTPAGWLCCGAPLEKLGDWDRLKSLRERNLSIFEGFQTIVTSCPGCQTHFTQHYSLQPLHAIEFLYESKRSHARQITKSKRLRVALHHPCHLARTIGPHVMDYAAELIQNVPGVRLVEMAEADRCCGGGGGVVAGHPDVALHLAQAKVRTAKEAKAELLIAPCPFCVTNIRRAGGIEVKDLVVFLDESATKRI